MYYAVNLEVKGIHEAFLKPVLGRANILHHLVIILMPRDEHTPREVIDKDEIVSAAEHYCGLPEHNHYYYSIYDFDGERVTGDYPFREDGRE